MTDQLDELLEIARGYAGDSLRALATFEDKTFDIHYIRDDIDELYSEEENQRVFDELVLSGLSSDYLEQIFHAGQIECVMYGFEEAAMFRFITGRTSGVFLTFDRDAEVKIDAFIRDCRNLLG